MKFIYLLLLVLATQLLAAQPTNHLAQAQAFATQQKVAFEENKGQVWDAQGATASYVKYHYQQREMDIFMLPTGLAYQFSKVHYPAGYQHDHKHLDAEERAVQQQLREQIRQETYRMDMTLVGANPTPTIVAEGESKDYVQYYNRNALDVHSFQKLIYQEVYPGIDWVIYTTEEGLKYDFVVQAGADPSQIKMRFDHQESIKINADGSFTLSNSMGSVTEQAPVSFQQRQEVVTAFELQEDVISFALGAYDESEVLVIDPSLVWASYYGGSNIDQGNDCVVDGNGDVYLVGNTASASNIAMGGHQNASGNGFDAYIVKFSSNGTRLWASYYGGSNYEEGNACAVDGSDNVYLVGTTESTTNIAAGGHQNTKNAYNESFIVKFNSSGMRLWGSYYGGEIEDYGFGCTVDGNDNVYLVGVTKSSFSISFNGHQDTVGGAYFLGGPDDAFIVKFNSSGTRLWASYYGGRQDDRGYDCVVDSDNNVYLAGVAYSNSAIAFNGHQNTRSAFSDDAFLVKFNSNGTRLWASYYGGDEDEEAITCVINSNDDVYLLGTTRSTNKIASILGHQYTYGGNGDAFIVKFNSNGTRSWGTYYGDVNTDQAYGGTIDANDNVYMVGRTFSDDKIAAGGYQNTRAGNWDGFVAKFDTNGRRVWGTYYGGADEDRATSCAVGNNNLYLIGNTFSTSGIALGGHQNNYQGGGDAFIAKFNGNCSNGTVTIQTSGNTILVDTLVTGANAVYQWIDCNSSDPYIIGATNPSFMPGMDGNYAVVVTQNSCIDTSACVSFVGTSTQQLPDALAQILVYPNPSNGTVNVDLGDLEALSIGVYSADGKLLQQHEQLIGSLLTLDLPRTAGVYWLQVITAQGVVHHSVVRE